ncbi:MAG: outer membrane protein assembly factor BamC, partial [Pseudomonadota bacterium]
MNRNLFLSTLAMAVLILSGCSSSFIESKKIDYKSAGKLPPLEIPPDLTTPSRDGRYAVPDITPKGSATYSAYAGERGGQTRISTSTEVLPQVDKMHIERSGTQRWLVVKGSPDKLWPAVKEFWQESGFIVNVELPEAGIMETDWAENRAKLPLDIIRKTLGKVFDSLYSTSEQDKFRTRLEQGLEPGTTEIYLSHRGMVEIYVEEGKVQTRWQPRPADPELEAEMLRRLMVRLGVDESRAKNLIAAGTGQARAKMVRAADGSAALELQDPFDRAWRRVGLSLDRVGFTVEDRDRAQGVYFVRYVDPEFDNSKKEDQGFLSKLAFWRSSKSDAGKNPKFRIHIKGDGSASSVQVLTRE